MALIEFKNYSWQYLNTRQPALNNINLTINEGEFVGVVGANGSGKTTFSYSINGLIPGQYHGIKKGEVLVFGKEVEKHEKGLLQQKVGMVFSDPEAQFTAMTVEDELVFGMENIGMTIPQIQERLDWVTELTALTPLLNKPPYELSGGQKQRVAVAAVLAMTPQVVIMDEPTSMLDPISRKRVFDVLKEIKTQQKNTIIVVEHSLEQLVPLADRFVLLHRGEVLLAEPTREFFQKIPLLIEKGVNPPGILRFFHLLSTNQYPIESLPLTVEEAKEILEQLLNQKRKTSSELS